MVGLRLGLCTVAAASLLAATAARAADYPQPPPQVIYVPPPVIEEFSGWYLRGDIGFSNQQVGSLFNDTYNSGGFTSVSNINKSFDAAPIFGLGVGYYFNDWLRFDVTGEYRAKANFHGFDIGAIQGGGFIDDRYTASKSEWTFLFNGYIDLGTWENFTPFVGAGVGASYNTISNFGDVSTCVNSNNCTLGGSDAYASDFSKWNFAWALYAGVAYKITKNVSMEFSYRYIDLGEAQTGTVTAFDGTTCGCSNSLQFRHLTSNDFRLGIRVNLDAFAARQPVYYAPPPPQYYAPPPVYSPPPVYAPPPPLRSRG